LFPDKTRLSLRDPFGDSPATKEKVPEIPKKPERARVKLANKDSAIAPGKPE
jgi:hypothetical protein